MKRLPQAIITLMTLTFLGSPIAAFARDADVIRPDGHSLQNVYSLRGHFMFVNRVSKRFFCSRSWPALRTQDGSGNFTQRQS